MSDENNGVFALVGNIPHDYHSSDLRNYFSQFIETGGFLCFHFKHRPEIKKLLLQQLSTTSSASGSGCENASATSTSATCSGSVTASRPTQAAEFKDETDTVIASTGEGHDNGRASTTISTDSASSSHQLNHYNHIVHHSQSGAISSDHDGDGTIYNSLTSTSEVDLPSALSRRKTMCCIVKVKRTKIHQLLKMYHRKHWLDKKGESLKSLCFISRIKLEDTADPLQKYKTRAELFQSSKRRTGETMSLNDVNNIMELHPPKNVMPQGNVGTPTKFFLEQIQACRLPAGLIGKLGLKFPKHRAKRMYGDVPFDYGLNVVQGRDDEDEEVKTADGHEIEAERKIFKREEKEEGSEEEKNQEEELDEEDGDDGEEWERHATLHDDPANAERNKERVYEEELEIVWEKGGPGIVWYTDEKYWREQEGDFDEQTTDDWDVDTSVYYEETGGDKDSRDFVLMHRDKRRRQGVPEHLNDPTGRIGKFEKHTKGIGRQVMEKQGWTDGQGLGHWVRGISDALDSDGQNPKDKTGFGYRGEKVVHPGRPAPKRKVKEDHIIISTIYDDPVETDPKEELIRRQEPYHIKYRAGAMRFHKASEENS